MDEDEYRSAYQQVNPQRCGYEKALLTRTVHCQQADIFCLAERYGVACGSASSSARCSRLLQLLRQRGSFALGLTSVDDRLPHSLEMKVQMGGLAGIQRSLEQEGQAVDSIDSLLEEAARQFDGLENLPFGDIVQSMVRYETRRKRR